MASHLQVDADPDSAHHFDADPDSAHHYDADPDPAYHFDADPYPDPTFQFIADPDVLEPYPHFFSFEVHSEQKESHFEIYLAQVRLVHPI